MKLQEIVTKVAIVMTFIVLGGVGVIPPFLSFVLMLLGLWVSFVRDKSLAERGIHRMLPSYGVIMFGAVLIGMFLMITVNGIIGHTFLTKPQMWLAGIFAAVVVRAVSIFVEGGVNIAFDKLVEPFLRLFGHRGRMTNELHQKFTSSFWNWDVNSLMPKSGPHTGLAEPVYTDFVPPQHWRYQCPSCGARVQHNVGTCWNCHYGENHESVIRTPTVVTPTPAPPTLTSNAPIIPRGQ